MNFCFEVHNSNQYATETEVMNFCFEVHNSKQYATETEVMNFCFEVHNSGAVEIFSEVGAVSTGVAISSGAENSMPQKRRIQKILRF